MIFTECNEFRDLKLNPKGSRYLIIDTFLDVVVKKKFPLLYLGYCLFRVVSSNRYLPKDSNGNVLCITTTGNVFVAREKSDTSGDRTIFGLCRDSLNAVKFI